MALLPCASGAQGHLQRAGGPVADNPCIDLDHPQANASAVLYDNHV